ncbi:MAG: carboxypeptidase-like regulatory domain-containing protein, partial [Bacteroidaceae bacterium]|nr:carboxypeptidase-like regulatory domain-containing protein [Bacteroidaceae bacterium]
MKMNIRATLALILLYICIPCAWAQGVDDGAQKAADDNGRTALISGTITDDEHRPIEIANVKVEGQMAGTVSDLEGNYSVEVQSADTVTLVFSMIGYETRKRTLYNPRGKVRLNV